MSTLHISIQPENPFSPLPQNAIMKLCLIKNIIISHNFSVLQFAILKDGKNVQRANTLYISKHLLTNSVCQYDNHIAHTRNVLLKTPHTKTPAQREHVINNPSAAPRAAHAPYFAGSVGSVANFPTQWPKRSEHRLPLFCWPPTQRPRIFLAGRLTDTPTRHGRPCDAQPRYLRCFCEPPAKRAELTWRCARGMRGRWVAVHW